jgi:hypothetical protein
MDVYDDLTRTRCGVRQFSYLEYFGRTELFQVYSFHRVCDDGFLPEIGKDQLVSIGDVAPLVDF